MANTAIAFIMRELFGNGRPRKATEDSFETMGTTCTKKQKVEDAEAEAARVVSAICCRDAASLPVAVPVSFSDDSSRSDSDSDCNDSSAIIFGCCRGSNIDVKQRYRISSRVIGTGIHGSVRKCYDRRTGERCAVKSIRKDHPAVRPDALRREISLLQEMRHGNIIPLRDVFEDADYIHIVTDLCEGGELFERIIERSGDKTVEGCFAEDEASRIIYQVLTAVRYLHEHRIVHRDIKPENILFDSSDGDSVKLIDFGLARRWGEGDAPMSRVVGTPYYIDPNVLRKNYTRSCDLWSVGIVAYILIAGHPPFNKMDVSAIHRAVLKGRYRFASKDWKHTTKESRDFVRRLLQADSVGRMTVDEALAHPWITRHNSEQLNTRGGSTGA
ncbi:hypothetical protein THAOC_34806 [Thalassiosira oceanica]|uniref:Protein kinase domain-containing protein n=1 Tax=Thalassiosira oceanica TaxID=159749 RepID=K0RBQ2_THAOC|nr:hypothetical protein THAOC_34806 [Thalassiosira oceanica]|mmetsp:Transcript_11176/g.26090  ORF Transcript_11176/g.26090 Transcript_11176/m.26090 type:complete len:386 (+) Transcript_11176:209-1366(+)|eukprot:EJK46521.1 hypothetical protein THAOC_34806 [Thalassiosira oceanica]